MYIDTVTHSEKGISKVSYMLYCRGISGTFATYTSVDKIWALFLKHNLFMCAQNPDIEVVFMAECRRRGLEARCSNRKI